MEKVSPSDQFEKALEVSRIKICRYDPTKTRSITIGSGGTLSVEKFGKRLLSGIGAQIVDFPHVFQAVHDISILETMVDGFCKEKDLFKKDETVSIEIPDAWKELTLNLDQTHSGRDLKFFMTTPKEVISEVAGSVFMKVTRMDEDTALSVARKVVPQYLPRSPRGTALKKNINGEELMMFNSYIPPKWMNYEGDLPDRLPKLFERLVNHLFPLKVEREYFYAWLYESLFNRAFVYLVLCGAGGTGKNRLKLVMRALHGHQNTVDGKRSTLIERFNSQLADSTLAWFDELSYDIDTENVMKEIQNDSISIERKGVDATRSTSIYASLAISNNKPRDNYIAFDARKFVPLQITPHRLDTAMNEEEIDTLTRKVEKWSSPDFDIRFLAQIGRWIKKHGKAYSRKWHHLEYKGPMFYKLAHTSMSRWQKKAASILLDGTSLNSSRIVFDENKGYLWSTIAEQSMKKNGDRSLQFPDYTTVKHFFDIFVDGEGRKAFKTRALPKDIMGDFHVQVLNKKAKLLTEAEVLQGATEEDEVYDL